MGWLTRAEGQSAAEWQAELFDHAIRHDPDGAFGKGPMQEMLWRKRIDLACRSATRGAPVLDIGAGNGRVARAVAGRTGARVVAIDASAECVRLATARNPHPNVRYECTAIEHYEPDEPLSLVTMYEVLEHLGDPAAVLRRIRTWLRPGGHLIFSTPNRSSLNRRIKTVPGLRRAYEHFSELTADGPHPAHVEEYRYEELLTMVRAAGLAVERTYGGVLLIPFPDAIGRLARSALIARLNVQSGDWCPRLATQLYVVARR